MQNFLTIIHIKKNCPRIRAVQINLSNSLLGRICECLTLYLGGQTLIGRGVSVTYGIDHVFS